MKRFFALLLCLCLVASLAACGTSSESQPQQPSKEGTTTAAGNGSGEFLVGYSKVNITPDYSIPLRGYGKTEKRMSTGFSDYIYATCAAITGTNGETVVVYGIDLTNAFSNCFPDYRQAVADAVGIPLENVHMSCSHMHSGCDMTNTKVPSVSDYIRDMEAWLIKGAEKAMEDRKPATIQYASTNTTNLNFIRRYYREDGTPAGDNYGYFSDSPIARHEVEVDNQLQLIKFLREDGNDVIMANFQMHPHRNGGSKNTNITADIVGVFRDELEKQLKADVLYFTGASGNVNPTSRISSENITKDYREQGVALAQYAIDLEGSYTDIPVGPVYAKTIEFTGPTDHSQDSKIVVAKMLNEAYQNGASMNDYMDIMEENQINSFFAASAIVTKFNEPDTRTTGLFTFSVSDLGFAVVPFEMFSENGQFVKEHSPFTATFVLTCANQHNTYLPSAIGFQNGGYEVDQSKYAAGTGEVVADKYVEMLTELKNK